MNFSVLAAVVKFLENVPALNLNWIARAISWLITNIGQIGVGIIVFTILLKLVTSPLDVYSRVAMRKNNLKMEAMRPQLEKLQKQYASNQQIYNQKMAELYKQNGYSMFSACLPTLVTLIIFIVVFSAFNSYSQNANLNTYRDMVDAYNAEVRTYCVELDETPIETVNGEYITYTSGNEGYFIYYIVHQDDAELANKIYYIDVDKAYDYLKTDVDALMAADDTLDKEGAIRSYLYSKGRAAAKVHFESIYNENKFLWVKNIWQPDTVMVNIIKSYNGAGNIFNPNFVSSINKEFDDGSKLSDSKWSGFEYSYEEITADLGEYKEAKNGYFILVILSIGSMFLSQFVSMRSQKAQTELQTADGKGKSMQKFMLIGMPLIFGLFSFGYSAAFSIYMATSSIVSMVMMIAVNKLVDLRFKKLAVQAEQEKINRRLPRK